NLDNGVGYNRVSSFLSRWIRRDCRSRLLYAPRRGNVVYDFHLGLGILLSSGVSEQTHLFLLTWGVGFLDTNVVLHHDRDASFYFQSRPVVVTNRGYCL